jgi:hypothetical protein
VERGLRGWRERERWATREDPRFSAFRAPHTNSLTLPATRQPHAGPLGGTQFPDKFLLAKDSDHFQTHTLLLHITLPSPGGSGQLG